MTEQSDPPPGAAPDGPNQSPDDGPGPPPSTGMAAAPPPGPETGVPRPLFRRAQHDKVVAGVAGGLARTLEQDAVLIRIVTVVLCLAFPPALIAYLGAWLLVARDDEEVGSTAGGIAFRRSGGVAFWLGVAVLAGALLAAIDDPFTGGFNLVPLVLIGIGVALWTRGGASTAPAPARTAPAPASTAPEPAPTTFPAGGDMPTATRDRGAPPPAPPPTSRTPTPGPRPAGPPPPPPPRSPLGGVTIALALIATGVVAALDQMPGLALDADPGHLAAVALLVLGLGQLVGAVWGRARWLTLVALVLIPPVLVGTVVRGLDTEGPFGGGIDVGDGVGERVVVLDGADVLPRDISLLAGKVTVDLQDWQPTAAQVAAIADDDGDLVVNVGAGEVVLITPTEVPWRVVGRVGLGDTSITSRDTLVQRDRSEDLGSPLEVLRTGGPQDGPVLDIVVDLRLGELDLHTPPFTTTEEPS